MSTENHAPEDRKVKEFPPKPFGDGGQAMFDNRVQIRDERTGRLTKLQPYAKHHMGKDILLERPIGSGNMFDEQDKPIGNWKYEGAGSWVKVSDTHVSAKAHVDIYDPQSGQAKISELEAELAALRAERAPKVVEPEADEQSVTLRGPQAKGKA